MIFWLYLAIVAALATLEKCKDALENDAAGIVRYFAGNTTNLSSVKRLYYSGKDVNDLGLYNMCLLQENSNYLIISSAFEISTVYLGLCLPSECNTESFAKLLSDHQLSAKLLTPEYGSIQVNYPVDHKLSVGGGFLIAFMFILVLILIIGSTIDNVYRPKTSKLPIEKSEFSIELTENLQINELINQRDVTQRYPSKFAMILVNFSVFKNWGNLYDAKSEETLRIFDGIKTLSLCWIILAQVFLARIRGVVINVEEIPFILGWFSTAFDYGGFYAVDAFVWISGFFTAYLALKAAYGPKREIK